ncbi:unnamed protein product [Oppiella nova]|uniref:F-box domain-containing protein n=1 Tax=Oppiella nova TaxID=334625 RepID=A0A7R9QG77_9ACAR|nr:unnamed protein product [Oppiella nova]CAG2164372.1 unnamed protein product [Oppiella nova]
MDTIASTGSTGYTALLNIVLVSIQSAIDSKKVSLDRFGDDLCEVLLSYLSIKDRFRYECVSKQWQRLIYTTVTDLKTSEVNKRKPVDTESHLQAFELLLKKCPNIAFIYCRYAMSVRMLSLITKHCNHLNGIYMSVERNTTNETINEFFANFAKRLQSLEWTPCQGAVEGYILNNMKCCQNLRELYLGYEGNQLSHVLSDDRNEIVDYDDDDKSIAAVMTGLSQMRALIDLNIDHPVYEYTDVVNDHLRQIGVNCPQIRRLALKIRLLSNSPYDELIAVLNDSFKRLKRLEIVSNFNEGLPNEGVNPCKRITHLRLNSLNIDPLKFYDHEIDHMVANVDKVFPSIVSLSVNYIVATDDVLRSLARLPKVRFIKLENSTYWFTRHALNDLRQHKPDTIIEIT